MYQDDYNFVLKGFFDKPRFTSFFLEKDRSFVREQIWVVNRKFVMNARTKFFVYLVVLVSKLRG